MLSLPLRLWAPPILESCMPQVGTFVIEAKGFTLVIDDLGIFALAIDEYDVNEQHLQYPSLATLGLSPEHFPKVILKRPKSSSSSSPLWYLVNSSEVMKSVPSVINPTDLAKLRTDKNIRPAALDASTAALIVNSIQLYYQHQVLEPSVKGFLRILSMQFPRNDLYLFELLQNAVDDGARNVSFTIIPGGLRFLHDGRRFNPLDVMGLASVGLSTKAKKKRTVGFMGVGFKACYKRYSEVIVSDGLFRFQFTKTEQDEGFSWVMQPRWIENQNDPKLPQVGTGTSCCFDLKRCTGGKGAPLRDLSYLPPSVPPLLGRTAMERMKESQTSSTSVPIALPSWTLNWNGRIIQVRSTRFSASVNADANADDDSNKTNEHEVEEVTVHEMNSKSKQNGSESKWIFLNDQFEPDAAAKKTYCLHTKKNVEGIDMLETVSIFFRVGKDRQDGGVGEPLPPKYGKQSQRSTSRGRIHAVLPTKLSTPFGFHVQGNWLLSVDRTDMQDSFENAWNRCMLNRLPMLIVRYLRWIVQAQYTSSTQRCVTYDMLPSFETNGTGDRLKMIATGVALDCMVIDQAIRTERLIPTLSNCKATVSPALSFSPASTCMFYPSSFACLPFLSEWLVEGTTFRDPVDVDSLGSLGCSSLLWRNVPTLSSSSNMLQKSATRLRNVYAAAAKQDSDARFRIVSLVASALGSAWEETEKNGWCENEKEKNGKNQQKETKKRKKNGASSSSSSSSSSSLTPVNTLRHPLTSPPPNEWYIFDVQTTATTSLPSSWKVVSPKHLRIPDENYCSLNPSMRNLLYPYIVNVDLYASSMSIYERKIEKRREDEAHNARLWSSFKRQQSHKRGGKNKHKHRGGSGNNKKQPKGLIALTATISHPVLLFPISQHWLPLCCTDDNDTTLHNMSAARSCIEYVRRYCPLTNVTLRDIIGNFFRAMYRAATSTSTATATATASTTTTTTTGLSIEDIERVLEVTRYCFSHRLQDAVTHVLVSIDEDDTDDNATESATSAVGEMATTTLVPASSAYVRNEHLITVRRYLSKCNTRETLHFVSNLYRRAEGKNTIPWSLWFKKIGVRSGITFQYSAVKSDSKDVTATGVVYGSPVRLRKTKKIVTLPYGLLKPLLDHRTIVTIDCDFEQIWCTFLSLLHARAGAGANEVEAFGKLLAAVLGNGITEFVCHPTKLDAKSLPVAQATFSGHEIADSSFTTLQRGCVPGRRRLYFLPPGQGGGEIRDLCAATWVTKLRGSRFVPTLNSSSGVLSLFRPSSTVLSAQTSISHLKISSWPLDIRRALEKSPLYAMLSFGKDPVPTPMEMFRSLVLSAKNNTLKETHDQFEVCAVWNALLASVASDDANSLLHQRSSSSSKNGSRSGNTGRSSTTTSSRSGTTTSSGSSLPVPHKLTALERSEIARAAKQYAILPDHEDDDAEEGMTMTTTNTHTPAKTTTTTLHRWLSDLSSGSRPVDALKESMRKCGWSVDVQRTGLHWHRRAALRDLLCLPLRPTASQATSFLRYLCERRPNPNLPHVVEGLYLSAFTAMRTMSTLASASTSTSSGQVDVFVQSLVLPIRGPDDIHWRWAPVSAFNLVLPKGRQPKLRSQQPVVVVTGRSCSLDTTTREEDEKKQKKRKEEEEAEGSQGNTQHHNQLGINVFRNDDSDKARRMESILRRRKYHEVISLSRSSPFKHLERKVHARISMPKISDDVQFSMSLSITGKSSNQSKKRHRDGNEKMMEIVENPLRDGGMEQRLRIVCKMMNADCQRLHGGAPLPIDTLQVLSAESMTRKMSTPIVRGSREDCSHSAVEESTCWAAWKSQTKSSPSTATASTSTSLPISSLYLSGDNDDYVSDLMRALADVIHDYEKCRTYSMRPEHINLLYHINSSVRFAKFVRRDFSEDADQILLSFASSFISQDITTVTSLNNDSVNSRDNDENKILTKRLKSRPGVAEAVSIAESGNALSIISSSSSSSSSSFSSSSSSSNSPASLTTALGRGRGKTLPAWMTEKTSGGLMLGMSTTASEKTDSIKPTQPDIEKYSNTDVAGNVGNVVSEFGKYPIVQGEKEQEEEQEQLGGGGGGGEGGGRGLIQINKNSESTPAADIIMIGRGRGRGLNRTLPAWATTGSVVVPESSASSAHKRKREDDEATTQNMDNNEDDEGKLQKRSKSEGAAAAALSAAAATAATGFLNSIVLPPPISTPPIMMGNESLESMQHRLSTALTHNTVLKQRVAVLEQQIVTLTRN